MEVTATIRQKVHLDQDTIREVAISAVYEAFGFPRRHFVRDGFVYYHQPAEHGSGDDIKVRKATAEDCLAYATICKLREAK